MPQTRPAFLPALRPRLVHLANWAQARRRGLTAAGLSLLAGYGITAFGIAPLAPDAAELPRTVLQYELPGQDLAAQLDALADHRLTLTRHDSTRPGDSVDSLLRRLGANDPDAARWLRTDPLARRLLEGRAGKMVSAEVDGVGRLQSLIARFPVADRPDQFQRLSLKRSASGEWSGHLDVAALETSVRLASGTIRSSLFAATDEAGLPDPVAVQMAEIFAADIDFHRELRKGDTFSLVFEALTADGEPVTWNQGSGRVLAAEFVNQGRSHQAVWFAAGKGGYFDLQGESKRRSFLASPMEFSRVTSGFAMRFHPILQRMRAHMGVDYGAPTGTPVRSVGDGVVEFAGVQGGYGNVVQVRHAGDRLTVYAHLSRIDVKKGQRIDQGQRLGAVGATGWATGPHLHFEFRVNGVHKDPLQIARSAETVRLEAAHRPRFQQMALAARQQLAVAAELQGLPGRVE